MWIFFEDSVQITHTKKTICVAETRLEELTTKVICKGGATLRFTSDGQTTITNSRGAQIGYKDGELSINGVPVEKPAFDHEQIKKLEQAIELLKHLRMISGLEIGFIQGNFEPKVMGYSAGTVPSKDVEAERAKVRQFIGMCDQLIEKVR
jgi:hypothetical protein